MKVQVDDDWDELQQVTINQLSIIFYPWLFHQVRSINSLRQKEQRPS